MAFFQTRARLGASLLAASLLLGASAAHANLLTNGSFEDLTHFSDQGNDTNTPNPGDSTTLVGWTVITQPVSWIGPTNPFGVTASPGGGSYFLDLSGYHNGDPTGGVQQTIATHAGATYLITFDLGSGAQYGLPDGLHLSAGATGADFASTNDGLTANLWEAESLSFVATGALTTITFQGNLGQNYVGLDNIDVTVTHDVGGGVPEPAAWAMMLVGFGGLGAVLRRRRRTLAAA